MVTLISAGVALMVATETAFYFTGMLMCVLRVRNRWLRWSLTQILLKKQNMGTDTPAAMVFTLAFVRIAVEGLGARL